MSQHHDPVHPDSDHLSAEVLADLDLGLLDDASAAHAEAHLTHCAACSALRGDLAALTAALPDLPAEPMPDAVWQQLSDAIAAEPVLTPSGSAGVVPIETAGKRRWGRPGIGIVAGAAGVALFGAIIVPSLSGSSDNASTASDGGGPIAGAEQAGPVPLSAYAATRSGTRYQQDALGSQVTELVAARVSVTPSPDEVQDLASITASPSISGALTSSPTGDSTPNGERRAPLLATDPAAAQACLASYIGVSGVRPLAIDIGTWQGDPAAVIVLPVQDPTLAEVWVIDPTCSTEEDPLLYFATVSR